VERAAGESFHNNKGRISRPADTIHLASLAV
jgi:hypothetical protein